MNSDVFKIHSACTLDYLCSFFPGVVNHGLFFPYIVIIFHFLIRRTKVIGKQQTHGSLAFSFGLGHRIRSDVEEPAFHTQTISLPANAFLGNEGQNPQTTAMS